MKDKLLNFLLIFLLVFLILSFFNKADDQTADKSDIVFASVDNSYSIPASPKLNITNNKIDNITFNTCNDIIIKHEWGIINLEGSDVCKDISIKSGETETIDYWTNFEKFENVGQYYFQLFYDEKEYLSQFEIEYKGFFGKFFTFFFYAPVYNLMAFLIDLTWHSLGYAIIIITIIIRIILLAPQHKMMISQRKMQAIQPKIKEIQKKHKWNNQMLGVELMKLYKEEKVNPMWSCLLLLIQMPILIVIYHIIISIQDLSNSYYLYGFIQDFDILAINYDFYGIDLLWVWGTTGIVLALIVWAVQFIQIKLSIMRSSKEQEKNKKWVVLEKKKWEADYSNPMMPDPEMMNKVMLWAMPVMVGIFTYTFFAWVGIYWWVSTIFMIFQQIIVNKIVSSKK